MIEHRRSRVHKDNSDNRKRTRKQKTEKQYSCDTMTDQGLIYVLPSKSNYGVHQLRINFSDDASSNPSEDDKMKDEAPPETIESRPDEGQEILKEDGDNQAISKILNILEESRQENVQRLIDKKKEELELHYKKIQDLNERSIKSKKSFAEKLQELEQAEDTSVTNNAPPEQNSTFTTFSNFTNSMSTSFFGSSLPTESSSMSSTFKFVTSTPSTPTMNGSIAPSLQSTSSTFPNFNTSAISNASTIVESNVFTESTQSNQSKIDEDSEMQKDSEEDVLKPSQPIITPSQSDSTNIKEDKSESGQNSKVNQDALQTQLDAEYQLETFCKDFEKSLKSFTTDDRFKAYRTELQLFIRTTINTISGNSLGEVKTKSNQMIRLLTKAPINYQGKQLDCCQHPDALNFCLNFAAKTFISSGVVQVSSVSAAAFPIGAVIALIWSRLPTFGKLFLGSLVQKCPYVKPSYSDNQTENNESYAKRCRALVMIYGAVIQIKLSNKHPHGMRYAWIWLSSKLRQNPDPYISANILQAFLQTTSFKMANCYKQQFYKIIFFIKNVYLPMISKLVGAEGTKQPFIKFELFIKELIDRLKKFGLLSQPAGYIDSVLM